MRPKAAAMLHRRSTKQIVLRLEPTGVSVILVDLANEQNDRQCNWYNWRPTLELIRRTGRISDEQLERMGSNGGGATVSADDAVAIARFIEIEIIPNLKADEMIHRDGRISQQPASPRLITETPSDELYAARKKWLESFVEFCKSCKGFDVL
jgi:hypothetical protein